MTSETNKSTSRRLFAAFDKGDFAAVRALLAPGMTATLSAADHPLGAEDFEAMGRMFTTAFAQGRHVIKGQIAEGDWVASRIEWTAVHVAPFNGIAATQRPVKMGGIVMDRYAGGKIAEHHAALDLLSLMGQLGAMPVAA